MKRELLALGLVLLLVLATLLDLRCADRLLDAAEGRLLRVEQAAGEGDSDKALAELLAARSEWDRHAAYEQVFFRHPDLDQVQDAFFALEQVLRQGDPSWPAALALLRYRLRTIDAMEHLSIGTIF